MTHRNDIDGLRAVAIVPVLLFHAGVSWIPGGFTGVDVFFVISGFLITGLILNDVDAGKFSIVHFYERRVRRILPALFFLLICTSLAAYALFLPDDAREFGRSLFATMLFSSNILFAKQTGYFQPSADVKPLLHTWSLAVEEQFYILYPLFLFLLTRYLRRRYAMGLFSVFALSLAFSIWDVHLHRSVAFYSSGARAWELLLGGILARPVIPLLRGRIVADVVGVVGLGLLVCSFVFLSGSLPFPGLNALCPTLGTALIIYSGTSQETFVSKTLSTKPVVFIGLISYSLYLWHWVLIVFYKYSTLRQLTPLSTSIVISTAVIIATLSWKFVENPFRGPRKLVQSRRLLFAGAATGSAIFVLFAGVLFYTQGLPARFSKQVMALLAAKNDYWPRRDACLDKICPVGDADAAPTFILWGDSHAGAIAPAFEQIATGRQISGFVASSTACAPLLGLMRYDEDDKEKCVRFNQSVLNFIESKRVRNVFLHARWGLYAEGTRFSQEWGGPALLTADRDSQKDYAAFALLLNSTVARLRQSGLNVAVIGSVPEIGLDVPTSLARVAASGRPPEVAIRYSDFMARQARTFNLFSHVEKNFKVRVVYPHELLCNSGWCSTVRDNRVLYVDSNHLSVQGADYLVPELGPLLEPLESRIASTEILRGHGQLLHR